MKVIFKDSKDEENFYKAWKDFCQNHDKDPQTYDDYALVLADRLHPDLIDNMTLGNE